MLSLLISILISVVFVTIAVMAGAKPGIAPFVGSVGFLVPFFLIGWLVRKKVTAIQQELQAQLMNSQQRLTRKVQQFQSKPGGNLKLIQRQIDSEQQKAYQEALQFTDRFIPFKKWNLLMGRQIATMRMQFLYQLKDFEQVDVLLFKSNLFNGPMLLEPMAVAMKIARQYKRDDITGAEKTFKKKVKWFKGDRATLLYGLMSWIYMKQGESEKARQLLLKGKESTMNETLAKNWEKLSNNQDKSFSNAGLGEEWYGLYLETPAMPKQQRVRGNPRQAARGF